MSLHRWLQRREYSRLPPNVTDRDFIMKRVYSSIIPYFHWNDLSEKPNVVSEYGAVFNMEFSPEGNVLVAACEKKAILLFDSITTKQTNKITDAHTDNVNCIKFLDDRMFATCSDDTTVALWDLRYLKMKVRSLHGHSNWVKNIEYSQKDKLLVTSGFDGSIFTWDINSHTEQGLIYQKVFHTSGLMRCRIAPDGTKLVICTTGGYLMIIHNLNLTTLHKDLCGFRPSIYRLMQMGHQYIPQAAKFDHVFSKRQKKNRVELVTDFPAENDAEVVLALQIHPQGHSFLSRNISYDELSEWSCVHDINEEPDDITEHSVKEPSAKRKRMLVSDSDDEQQHQREAHEGEFVGDSDDVVFRINRRQRYQRLRFLNRTAPPPPPPPPPVGSGGRPPPPASRPETFVPDIWAAEVTVQERAIRQNRERSSNSVTGYNFVYAISSGVLPAAAIAMRTLNNSGASSANSRRRAAGVAGEEGSIRLRSGSPDLTASTDGSSTSSDSPPHMPFERIRVRSLLSAPLLPSSSSSGSINNFDHQIFQNPKKLVFYIQESNKGKGFIKEPCFSADGRIICSPYDTGIRLLGFSEECAEYPRRCTSLVRKPPRTLVEVKTINTHTDIVLCTKFSPREPLLVTGCRSGKVVWYHPNL